MIGRKQNSSKILVLFSSSFLLLGCSSNTLESSPIALHSYASTSDELTIQTVEFNTEKSVINVAVRVYDFFSGVEIANEVVNNEGKVTFEGFQQDEPYEVVIYRILPNEEWLEQTREVIVFDLQKPTVAIETFNSSVKDSLSVPVVKQNPELPNGCEVTALAAILNYYGVKADKVDLAKNYLPKEPFTFKDNVRYGPDPNVAYAGDPALKKGGYYVYASPIVDVANQVLFENSSDYKAMNLSDASKKEIINYVQSGVPVLAWVTIDLKKPRTSGHWIIKGTNEKHATYMNLHAVVMTGYKDGKVTVMNPLTGYETIDENVFFSSFESLGSHAIVIL
ncbi:hypothetical protein FJQ64_13150 [Lysinibacillus sp. BW-2-10]|nr:hypothetical protein FJQ64_13150 [Lysinibacillus sp. BW-2-10]